MFSYRICQDQALVDKFLTSGYIPTEAEKQAAEDCFEEGILDCKDVDGQICEYNDNCSSGEPCWRNDWFTCEGFDAGDGTKCRGVDDAPIGSCYTSIAGGYTVTKQIKIPDYVSEHTLLSFRWNSFQTPQIYLTCADIKIVGDGGNNGDETSTTTSMATSTTSNSGGSPTSTSCNVNFDALVTTVYGDTVKLVGSIDALGNWDTSAAPALDASGYTAQNPLWSTTLNIPVGTSFEYKYIIVNSSGGVSWESDPNRSYKVPSTCNGGTIEVEGTWR